MQVDFYCLSRIYYLEKLNNCMCASDRSLLSADYASSPKPLRIYIDIVLLIGIFFPGVPSFQN